MRSGLGKPTFCLLFLELVAGSLSTAIGMLAKAAVKV